MFGGSVSDLIGVIARALYNDGDLTEVGLALITLIAIAVAIMVAAI